MSEILTFDVCFDRLIGSEGGYSNDPEDSGGETNWGISKRSYPTIDIKNLQRNGAKAIYKRDFWDKIEADKLPSSVTYQLFDFAVNSGIETAIRKLQSAIGVADDGFWGPHSKKTVSTWSESDLVMSLLSNRLDFMTRLKNWNHDGKGWARRIAAMLKYGVEDTD